MSLRDEIFAIDDRHSEEVDLTAEWGCKLYVRMMTVDGYGAWIKCARETPYGRESYVIHSTFDADGNQAFVAGTWKEVDGKEVFEPGDEAKLAQKGHKAMHKLLVAANRVNDANVKGE